MPTGKITSLFVSDTQFIAQQSESMNLSLHGWVHQLAFELEGSITQLTLKLAFQDTYLTMAHNISMPRWECQLWKQIQNWHCLSLRPSPLYQCD